MIATHALRILLVEDNPGDARLVRELLVDAAILPDGTPAAQSATLVHVVRLQDAVERLEAGAFDVILLDLSLPDAAGIQAVARLHAVAPEVPIVVMSAHHDESLALAGVEAGAQDYLVKGKVESDGLARALRYAIARKRDEQQRARQAEALRLSEQRLATVVMNAPLILFTLDCEGRYTLTTGKGLDALGSRPGLMVGRSIFESYPELLEVHGWVRRALAGQTCVGRTELAGLQFETWYVPQYDARGGVIGVIGVAFDVTERARAEAALQAEAERMAAIIALQQEVMASSLDMTEILVLLAARVQLLVGAAGAGVALIEEEDLVYGAASGLVRPLLGLRMPIAGTFADLCIQRDEVLRSDDIQHDLRVDPVLSAKLGTGSLIAVPLRQAGTVMGVLHVYASVPHAFSARDEQTLQLVVGLLASAMDHALAFATNRQLLDEYQVMLEAMDQSEQRTRTLIEKSPQGTCIVDEQGVFEVVNPAYAAMFGYGPEEMIGRPCTMLFPEDLHGPILAQVHDRLIDRQELTTEYEVRTRDGTPRLMRSTAITVTGHDGRPRRVSYNVDITEQRQNERRLSHAAHYDSLTALPNRVLFGDRLEQARLTAERQGTTLAVLQIDLNRFKEINDTYGHAAGDTVLSTVALRMSKVVRSSDTVARLGGDEYALLLLGVDEADALHVAKKLRNAVCIPIHLPDSSVTVDASIGIALYPEHSEDDVALLHHADLAMYVAKAAGGGAVVYAPDQAEGSAAAPTLASELRDAVTEGQLRLHYQPVFDHDRAEVMQVEALVRWQHPTRGLLAPKSFISLAEQTDSIDGLTVWVIEEALRQSRAWREQGITLGVSVNIALQTLQNVQFPDLLSALLRQYRILPEQLTLEITERSIALKPAEIDTVLDRLADLGVRLALDDFGAGSLSLSAVTHLRLQELKLHRSVIQEVATERGRLLISFLLGLGVTLDLNVVAEGVEDRATWEWLQSLGCRSIQGYYLSEPLAAAELVSWMRSRGWAQALATGR